MKKTIFALVTVFSFILTAGQSFAAARQWELDPGHTNVYFTVDHVFAKVRGRFDTVEGKIYFDAKNLAESSMSFTIKVSSIDTGLGKRDKHLLSPDFLDSGKYPLITFNSTAITDKGQGLYAVAGKLNIKGQTHDIVLPLTLAGIKDHPAVPGSQVIGFNGSLMLDRLAYGVGDGKYYKMGMVGKDVDILVTFEALSPAGK